MIKNDHYLSIIILNGNRMLLFSEEMLKNTNIGTYWIWWCILLNISPVFLLISGILITVVSDALIAVKGAISSYTKHTSHRRLIFSFRSFADPAHENMSLRQRRAQSIVERTLNCFIPWHCKGFEVERKKALSPILAVAPSIDTYSALNTRTPEKHAIISAMKIISMLRVIQWYLFRGSLKTKHDKRVHSRQAELIKDN